MYDDDSIRSNENLTLEKVISTVERIRANAGDDETAHSDEDDLHVAVLRAVASGHPDAKKMAEEALKTLEIKFCRWCA